MFYLQMRPGGFQCWLVLLRVKLWILAGRESPEDVYRDLDEEGKRKKGEWTQEGDKRRQAGQREKRNERERGREEREEKEVHDTVSTSC